MVYHRQSCERATGYLKLHGLSAKTNRYCRKEGFLFCRLTSQLNFIIGHNKCKVIKLAFVMANYKIDLWTILSPP